MIEPEPLQRIDRTYVRWRGQKLSYFSGCDYYRLSSQPEVMRAVAKGLKEFGLSVAASRLTTGNHELYGRLEARLARFFKAETALVVPSGYVANLVAAQGLAGQFSHALIEEAAHPSLVDAARMLDCPVLTFPRAALGELNSAVARCGPGAKVILLTEGMLSRDGSVAPLKEYFETLPRGAVLLVDDAHGAGILGAHGRGAVEHCGLELRRVIQTVTLSKAFGTFGGAILGSRALRNAVLERSRLFVGSTPLPLPLTYASLSALAILERDASLPARLMLNAGRIRKALTHAGVPVPDVPGPIIALSLKPKTAVAQVKSALLRARVYPPFLRYPGGPAKGYFRFVLSSEHTPAQLENLAAVLARSAPLLKPLSSRLPIAKR